MQKIWQQKSLIALFALTANITMSCKKPPEESSLKAGGPTTIRNPYIRSPESIEGTLTKSWEIEISLEEKIKYINPLYDFLGGVKVSQFQSTLSLPNGLYVVAINSLSEFIAKRLIDKQTVYQTVEEDYLFEGTGFSEPDKGCFEDDSKDWCDYQDNIRVNSLTKQGINPQNLSIEWKKRIMHNIQDIGEFMLLSIDNTLKIPDNSERHAAQYLMEEIFLKALEDGPITLAKEKKAWTDVIHTILLSGGFFLAPADTREDYSSIASFISPTGSHKIPDASRDGPGVLELQLSGQKSSGVIRNVKIAATFTHRQRGDLKVELERGNYKSVLYDGNSDPNRNLEDLFLTLGSDYSNSLKGFINQPSGPFQLKVYDQSGLKEGQLEMFVVIVDYGN